MAAGEEQGEQLPRLTITGEELSAENVERLTTVAQELGYAAVFQSATVEVAEQQEEEPSIPDLDVIIEANRMWEDLHQRWIGDSDQHLPPSHPRWNALFLLHNSMREAMEQYARHDLDRARGVVQELAQREVEADRVLASDMLDVVYREEIQAERLDEARSLHKAWRMLMEGDEGKGPGDARDWTLQSLFTLIPDMHHLVQSGRVDLRELLEEIRDIEGGTTLLPGDVMTRPDGSTYVVE